MKLYTQAEVKKLLETQRGNCYVAVTNALKENSDKPFTTETISLAAANAPQPAGDQFDKMYGIDPEKLFNEDLADKELQERFDRFKKDREIWKEKYNELVPEINSLIKRIVNLKELIVTQAVQGLSNTESVKRLAKLDDKFTKLTETADRFKAKMNEEDEFIEKYKDWNERKLFMHWKYLTLLKVTKEPWMEWKKQFEDVMI